MNCFYRIFGLSLLSAYGNVCDSVTNNTCGEKYYCDTVIKRCQHCLHICDPKKSFHVSECKKHCPSKDFNFQSQSSVHNFTLVGIISRYCYLLVLYYKTYILQ